MFADGVNQTGGRAGAGTRRASRAAPALYVMALPVALSTVAPHYNTSANAAPVSSVSRRVLIVHPVRPVPAAAPEEPMVFED